MKKIIILLFLIITLILSGCHANTHTETTENHGDEPVSENTDKTSDTDKNNVINNDDNNSDNTDGKTDDDKTDVINNDDKNSENTDGKNDNDNTDDKNENERIKYSGNSTEYENKSGYISYVSSGSNDGVSVPAEVNYWSGGQYTKPGVPKTRSIEFNGVNYDLKYDSSWIFSSSPYEVNEYRGNGAIVYFRSDTGEMTYFYDNSWLTKTETYKTNAISLDDARRIADKIAEEYITIDEYTVAETIEEYRDDHINYNFVYTKYIDGFKTRDALGIILANNGELLKVNWTNAGLFKDSEEISVDEESIIASINEKLNKIYGENFEYTFEIESQRLTYTPNGELAMVSIIDIDLQQNAGTSKIGTALLIATIIEGK